MVQGEEEGDVGGGKWRVSWVENYKRGKFNEGREREREISTDFLSHQGCGEVAENKNGTKEA